MNEISWTLTQHAKVINDDFQKFLELAYQYQGRNNFDDELNRDILNEGILTENDRGGLSSPWRDYQQVLPTLGCIISTKTESNLTFTDIGKAVANGEINFSDFLTIQALRLQYPNGNSISNGIYESHLNLGVFVKPGLLILETLLKLEALDSSQRATISTDECQHFLVPNRTNDVHIDPIAKAKLDYGSSFKAPKTTNYKKVRRNVQDWFQLLAKSSLFDVAKKTSSGGASALKLSKIAIENLERVNALIEGVKAEGYWIPEDKELVNGRPTKEVRLDWFRHYGSLPDKGIYSLWLPKLEQSVAKYEDDSKLNGASNPADISLGNVADSINRYRDKFEGSSTGKSGIEERLKASAKHEQMILTLNDYFIAQGFITTADPNSIDLFADKPGQTYLAEVKTTNSSNLSKQIRTGIGQLFEYRYRLGDGSSTSLILAISTPLTRDSFYVKFVNDLGIDLAVIQDEQITFFTA